MATIPQLLKSPMLSVLSQLMRKFGSYSVKLEWEHRDPADRVVVAIAKRNQAAIITADRKIASFYSLVIW